MGILGNDDIRWSMYNHYGRFPAGDIRAHHFIEKDEETEERRSGRQQGLVCRTREARLVDHGGDTPNSISSFSYVGS